MLNTNISRCFWCCSSFSVWVRSCETLDLSEKDKEKLDTYIDDLYDQIDKGGAECISKPMTLQPKTEITKVLHILSAAF